MNERIAGALREGSPSRLTECSASIGDKELNFCRRALYVDACLSQIPCAVSNRSWRVIYRINRMPRGREGECEGTDATAELPERCSGREVERPVSEGDEGGSFLDSIPMGELSKFGSAEAAPGLRKCCLQTSSGQAADSST